MGAVHAVPVSGAARSQNMSCLDRDAEYHRGPSFFGYRAADFPDPIRRHGMR